MGKTKQKKRTSAALSEKDKSIIMLTTSQAYHTLSDKDLSALAELYDQRPEQYDFPGTIIKDKDAASFSFSERELAEKVAKVLMATDDPYTKDVVRTIFLRAFYGAIKSIADPSSRNSETITFRKAEIAIFSMRYFAIYYDKFIKDKNISVIDDLVAFMPDNQLSPMEYEEIKGLYNSLLASVYTDVDEQAKSGNIDNNVFIASYKNSNLEITQITLENMLKELLYSSTYFSLILPVVTDGIECRGLSCNSGSASVGVGWRPLKSDSIPKTPQTRFPLAKAPEVTPENDIAIALKKIREDAMKKTYGRKYSPETEKYIRTLGDMVGEEVVSQTMRRVSDIRGFGYIINRTEVKSQDMKRIVTLALLRMEFCEELNGNVSDESLMKNKAAMRLLVSTVVSELYSFILLVERKEMYASKKPKKQTKKASGNSVIKSTMQKIERENEELKLENKRLKESGDGALSSLKSENKALREETVLAQKRSRQMESEIEELKRQIAELKDYNDVLQNVINNDDSEDEAQNFSEEKFRKLLSGRKILVWGVRQRDADLLEDYKELVCFVTDKGQRNPDIKQVSAYDGIIIGTNHSSHSMYYDIKNTANAAGVPYVHMRKRDTNISKFYEAVKRLVNGAENS